MTPRLERLRALYGGTPSGAFTLLIPTTGHSAKDTGTSITDRPGAPDGLLVHVHNGTKADALARKDELLRALGEHTEFSRRRENRPDPKEVRRREQERQEALARDRAEALRRQARARSICRLGSDPQGTPVELHLNRRRLHLPFEIAGTAVLYAPDCPWGKGTVPAMVAPLTCITTGKVVGVHRTALGLDGTKIGRKMLGTADGAAVMLDPLSAVTDTLHIAEGIETALAAREHYSMTPIWAVGSSAGIAGLPVLPKVKRLVVCGENDGGASRKAIATVYARWHAAGRTVEVAWPPAFHKDFNDAVMGGATA